VQADGEHRTISGLATTIEQRGSNGGFSRLGLIIEPALVALNHHFNSRIFHNLTVPRLCRKWNSFGDRPTHQRLEQFPNQCSCALHLRPLQGSGARNALTCPLLSTKEQSALIEKATMNY